MAQKFIAGEIKKRPGVYYRYSNNSSVSAAAMDGVNAIVIKGSWGPLGVVTAHNTAQNIIDTYGSGAGVEAALMLIKGGAQKVFVYRAKGTGGAKGSGAIGSVGTATAKYEGVKALSLKIQEKPGDATKKQAIVLEGTKQLELFEFTANAEDETAALKGAVASSKYIDVAFTATGVIGAATIELAGGADPVVTATDYSAGFKALEPYRYNVLTTDSTEAEVTELVKAYMETTENIGKFAMAVIGASAGATFATRQSEAKACNSHNVIYFGSSYIDGEGATIEGAKAINKVAGIISSTPSSQSIVHSVVPDAVDIPEKLTVEEYESAIDNGLLLLSVGPDGQVWFDTGINTMTIPSEEEDEGWKKIKRTKVRYEMMDRIDRVVAPLVGRINCDPDGIAAILQAGMGVLNDMVAERKILAGATMVEDPDNPYSVDSAWFIIQADDIDSLEKIYLHYQFRYSQA